jgi:DNA-binding HxlR family transcriptional regulator
LLQGHSNRVFSSILPYCDKTVETLARIGDKWTVMVVGALSKDRSATTRSIAASKGFRSACLR